MSIAAVVNTFNSENYIDLTLRSVLALTDEVVLCDMHSTDRTVEIAQSLGVKAVFHDPIGYVEPARAFVVDQTSAEWILIIDSDEVLSPSLVPVLQKIAQKSEYDVVWLPSENHMFGDIVTGAGFAADQDKHVRFFKRGMVTLRPEIHAGIVPVPDAKHLKLDSKVHGSMIHFNYVSIEQFVSKLNKYTSIEIDGRTELKTKKPLRILRRTIQEYRHRFYRRGGKHSGWRGFALSLLMVVYDIVTELKVIERAEGHTPEKTIAGYRAYAEKILES